MYYQLLRLFYLLLPLSSCFLPRKNNMITPTIVQSLKDAAGGFEIGGLTPSERHWMEELSKVYLIGRNPYPRRSWPTI